MASVHAHGLPSPAASANSPAPSNPGSTVGMSTLPSQRVHPLKPGTPKEIALISYVDEKILYITRRYGTKYTNIKTKANEPPGYTSFDQFATDLDPLIDLVWATGTPTLQIPYMLTFAGLVSSYIPSFPFSTRVFSVCKRLDAAFSALLHSHQAPSGARKDVSMTEKVRIKSLVDETRVTAVNAASEGGQLASAEVVSGTEDEDDDDDRDHSHLDGDTADEGDDDDLSTAMALARIYRKTMNILGDTLGDASMATLPRSDEDTVMHET